MKRFIPVIKNKGAQALLPARKALNQFGAPAQQSMGNYAKATPSGPKLRYTDIFQEGDQPTVMPEDV